MIFRDAERFLGEAIASVFAQTYPHWELLLIDDGSVDGSTACASTWAAREPRVRYAEHPGHANRGMSASRNLGIRHSRGEYLAFLDSDDVWFPSALSQQVALLDRWPAAMVYGRNQWWYSWTGCAEDKDRDFLEDLGIQADTLVQPPSLLPVFLHDKAVPGHGAIRRDTVERVGGYEDAFRREYEDQVFAAKVCLRLPVFVSGQCWYRYRQHPDSCVAVAERTGRSRAARLRYLNWLAAYMFDQGIRHPMVWSALEYELWRCSHPTQYRLWTQRKHLARGVMASIARGCRTVGKGAR
jgi:glycosyltransferase involved in cell wall biosynthesis